MVTRPSPEIRHALLADIHRHHPVAIAFARRVSKTGFPNYTMQSGVGPLPYESTTNSAVGHGNAAIAPFVVEAVHHGHTRTGDWRELFDVALFEPNRVKLSKRIEHARHAINDRLEFLTKDQSESGRTISNALHFSDPLTTLAELHKIVYARKSGAECEQPTW